MQQPIAYGRRSKLYLQDNNTILKLYNEGFPTEKVHAEYTKARAIWKSNTLKVPKPIKELIKDGKSGILFEKIDGIALMDLFQKKPWLYFLYAKEIVGVHRAIHKINIPGIPTQQEEFANLIEASGRLSSKDKIRLLEILNAKYEPVLCHGDFHHGNLIQTSSDDIYIIDWMDAFSGSYKLDVTLTAVNAMVSDAPNHIPVFYRNVYELLKRIIRLDVRYMNLYGLEKGEDYIYLAAGIHLARTDESNIASHRKYFSQTSP